MCTSNRASVSLAPPWPNARMFRAMAAEATNMKTAAKSAPSTLMVPAPKRAATMNRPTTPATIANFVITLDKELPASRNSLFCTSLPKAQLPVSLIPCSDSSSVIRASRVNGRWTSQCVSGPAEAGKDLAWKVRKQPSYTRPPARDDHPSPRSSLRCTQRISVGVTASTSMAPPTPGKRGSKRIVSIVVRMRWTA